MTDLALRPRSATEIIDLAVRLLRRHFGPLFLIGLVGVVPGLLAQALLLLTSFGGAAAPLGAGSRFTGGWLAAAAVSFVAQGVMFAALMAGADRALRGGAIDVNEALRDGVRRAGPVLGVYVLASIAVGFGFILLFVPGLYLAARLATALPVAAVEGEGVFASMGRAWARSEGHAGHALAVVLLLVLVSLVFVIAVGMVTGAGALLGLGGPRSGVAVLIVWQALAAVASAAFYPLVSNALLVLAYDLRVRREAYDVEAMVGALGAAR